MSELKSFAARDLQLKKILENFCVKEEAQGSQGEFKLYKYIPLDPVNSLGSPSRIVFEVKDQKEWQRPGFLMRWFYAARPLSLASSLGPCLVTLLLGIYSGYTPQMMFFLFSIMGILFLHLGVCFLNDYEDHMRLFDLSHLRGVRGTGGSGVIQNNWILAKDLRTAGRVCIVIGAAFGVPALLKSPLLIGTLGVIALLGVVSYSGLLKTNYRALGDGAVILLLGPGLVSGIAIATFGVVTPAILLVGILFGFLAEGVLHANNLQDIPLDTSRKIKTIAKKMGFKGAKNFLFFIYFFSFGLLVGVGFLLQESLILFVGLLMAFVSIIILRKVFSSEGPLNSEIRKLKPRAEAIHLGYSLFFIAALIYLTQKNIF